MVGIVLDGGGEERVDEGCLSESGLASDLERGGRESEGGGDGTGTRRAVLTMIVKAAPLLATILCLWLGRLAMPIGEMLSAGAGAILNCGAFERGRTRCR